MKLALLGLSICFGFPVALFFIIGPGVFNDSSIITGTMALGAVVFLMGCLCTVKNVLSGFFDFLLITFGACLLLIAAFARPLGLYDGEATTVENLFTSSEQQQFQPSSALVDAITGNRLDQAIEELVEDVSSDAGEELLLNEQPLNLPQDDEKSTPRLSRSVDAKSETTPSSVSAALKEYQEAVAEEAAIDSESEKDLKQEPEGLELYSGEVTE